MPEREELYRWTAEAYVNAHAVYGEIGLDCRVYAARIEAVARKYGRLNPAIAHDILPFLEQLHPIDLYLATACGLGSESAWNAFDAEFRRYLLGLCGHMYSSEQALREVFESIWSDLFLPDRSGASRIASYDGRSSLATWLRVMVSNRLINERRRKRNSVASLDDLPDVTDRAALKTVEARLWNGRYEGILRDCLEKVCKGLTARERLMLIARYEEGLRLGEIGRLLHIHLSSVTRQLDRLLKRIRGEVRARLASEYQLSPAAIDECFVALLDADAGSIPIVSFIKESEVCASRI